MKIKKFAAAAAAVAVLAAAVPNEGTLSYAEIIANGGGGGTVVSGAENTPKLIVDGKEIAPDSTYESYGEIEASYSIKGDAAHTYKIEYKGGGVCSIGFACEDSETSADYYAGDYFCEFSTTTPITVTCSEFVELIWGGVGGSTSELIELSGDIASFDEDGDGIVDKYSLGSQTGNGSGAFVFYGPSKNPTQTSTTVMNFDSDSDGTLEFTITAKGDSESSNTPVEIKDNTTNISVSADKEIIPDGAKLSVAAVADKTDDKNFTYEISFKKDGKEVQPNGSVTVKIPVPGAIKDKTIYVYRVEDGKYTDMKAKVEDGFVVFTTDHFSEYLVTTENKEDKTSSDTTSSADNTSSSDNTDNTNPATGIAGGMLGIMAIAGAFVIVSKKRR